MIVRALLPVCILHVEECFDCRIKRETYHLYQALQTVMQASSSALFKYVNTDTQTSFSPPLSLPTSLKEGRDSRDGGDREKGAEGAEASSSSEEDPE